MGAPTVIPMDVGIGHATTSYLDGYSQPSYATPHVTDFSAPYATSDIHYSAPHLHNGYSRLSGTSIGANVPSSSIVAYGTSPSQLQSFGNRSLPKDTKSIVRQSYAGLDELKERLLSSFHEFEALHRQLIERPHDPATIQAYEAYKKRSEERNTFKVRVFPPQF